MSNCLLHLRLTRARTTYGPVDYEPLVSALAQYAPIGIGGDAWGTNAGVMAIEWRENPAVLARLLQPALDKEPFEDWCLVEVNRGAAWMDMLDSKEDDTAEEIEDDDSEEDEAEGALYLNSLGPWLDTCPNHERVNSYGARGLLVELNRDIDHRQDHFVDNLQRRLGLHAGRHWHSRSMALLTFHDRREPKDIAPTLERHLDHACVSDWTMFTLGSQIASKAGMSSLNGWLDKAYRLDRGMPVLTPGNSEPKRGRRDADTRLGGPQLGVRR